MMVCPQRLQCNKAAHQGQQRTTGVIGIELHTSPTETELHWTHDGRTHVEIFLGRSPAEAKKYVDERVK